MGNMFTGPALSTSSGAIGLLELDLCCTGCGGGHFENCCGYNPCCPAIGAPHGPEWEAAAPGFAPYIAEAEKLAASLPGCLCGAGCYDAQAVKAILDARWLAGANAYLVRYNLRAEVFFWVTYNDKGQPQPHVAIQFFTYQPGREFGAIRVGSGKS